MEQIKVQKRICQTCLIKSWQLQPLHTGDSLLALLKCIKDRLLLDAGLDTCYPLFYVLFRGGLQAIYVMVACVVQCVCVCVWCVWCVWCGVWCVCVCGVV